MFPLWFPRPIRWGARLRKGQGLTLATQPVRAEQGSSWVLGQPLPLPLGQPGVLLPKPTVLRPLPSDSGQVRGRGLVRGLAAKKPTSFQARAPGMRSDKHIKRFAVTALLGRG